MTAVGRVFLIFFALIAAAFAAALVIFLGSLFPDAIDFLSDPQAEYLFFAMIGLLVVLVWGSSLLPALLMIVVLEAFAIRSVLIYGILGGGLAMLFFYGPFPHPPGSFLGPVEPSSHPFSNEVVLAAGIAAGMAYWLVAGRSAGRWRSTAR